MAAADTSGTTGTSVAGFGTVEPVPWFEFAAGGDAGSRVMGRGLGRELTAARAGATGTGVDSVRAREGGAGGVGRSGGGGNGASLPSMRLFSGIPSCWLCSECLSWALGGASTMLALLELSGEVLGEGGEGGDSTAIPSQLSLLVTRGVCGAAFRGNVAMAARERRDAAFRGALSTLLMMGKESSPPRCDLRRGSKLMEVGVIALRVAYLFSACRFYGWARLLTCPQQAVVAAKHGNRSGGKYSIGSLRRIAGRDEACPRRATHMGYSLSTHCCAVQPLWSSAKGWKRSLWGLSCRNSSLRKRVHSG